jgi:hypothetical protein
VKHQTKEKRQESPQKPKLVFVHWKNATVEEMKLFLLAETFVRGAQTLPTGLWENMSNCKN